MDAQEIVLQIRENAQIFSREPLRDGFATDVIARPTTRILPQANKAYRRLIEGGIYQCWHRLTLTVGIASYRTSGKFTLVLQDYIEDTSGVTYPLDLLDMERAEDARRQYFRDLTTGRPDKYLFTGNMIAFNTLPDAAYKAYFLADTVPTPLVLPTDTPTAVDDQFHDAIVTGGSVYIARMALGTPDFTQGMAIRYKDLNDEWQEYKKKVREVQVSRRLNVSAPPRMRDFYRIGSTRLRR